MSKHFIVDDLIFLDYDWFLRIDSAGDIQWYLHVLMTSDERQIAQAIKELRNHLQESQQDFSHRLGVTLATISRYESIKPPKGPIIMRFADLSQTVGRADLAAIFEQAEEAHRRTKTSPIAGAVRQLRAALNCTQAQLAEKAGVAVSTVARAETNTLPDKDVLRKFAWVAQKNNLDDLVHVFEQAQIPDFFATPEQRKRISLKHAILRELDEIETDRLAAVWRVIQEPRPPEGPVRPDREIIVDLGYINLPPQEEWHHRVALETRALNMVQAVHGRTEALHLQETQDAQELCATAWLVENDEEPEELADFLVEKIQRVLAERGSTLTATELEALGVFGARASSPAAILERARQLRDKHRSLQ